MAVRFRPPKPTSMTLNLAPMVDVMMVLIIFFLLGTSLITEETRPVNLPHALAASMADMGAIGPRVVVNVRKPEVEGEPAEYVVAGWDGRQVIEQTLTSRELETHLRHRAATAERADEVRCVIRADRDVEYRDVEVVLRACGLAKIARVSFSTNTGPDPEGRP